MGRVWSCTTGPARPIVPLRISHGWAMDGVELLPGLITVGEARAIGVDRNRIARGGFVRVRRGTYVPAGTPVDDADARMAIAASGLPDVVVLGGWAAARLHERSVPSTSDPLVVFDGAMPGVGAGDQGALPVLVCAPREARIRPLPGVTLLRSGIESTERVVLEGVPVTSALRTAFDLARTWPLTPGVVALDRLRNLGLIDAEELEALTRRKAGWCGVGHVRRALALSDGGAESPRETLLRLLWTDAGLARPLANRVVRDLDGHFVARVDLVDPDAGVVGEYDGGFHASAGRRSKDAARQERLEALGLLMIRACDPDLATPHGRMAWQMRLRDVYARARAHPPHRRSWILTDR